MPRESRQNRALRAQAILHELHRLYADATCALHHTNALELLIATILSAQCTDERVNQVTPRLFKRYPTAQHYAEANEAELRELIRPTGFFNNKARSIRGAGRVLVEHFNGQVPDTMEQLLQIPGVARKTANVLLGTWFGRNDGVVVDTHVGRLALRLRLAPSARGSKDAVRIEQDLIRILPQEEWTFTSHALIHHGRSTCTARSPRCSQCTLAPLCPGAHILHATKAVRNASAD